MLDLLLKAGSFLLDFFKLKGEADEDKKEVISALLNEISEVLDDVLFDIENDVYPHDKCAEMEMLSSNLIGLLKGLIDDKNLEILDENLKIASKIEQVYAVRNNTDELIKLQRAKGYFKAAAVMASI